LIFIFNLIVYWPSLKHMPRGDHLSYLGQVASQKDWITLVIRNMEINRGGNLFDGDTWLFRPFLYALLGAERFLFGYSFYLWQLAGVVLHLFFLWSLWKLLTLINENWVAFLFTAFFSVSPVAMDLVIWSHINGYLVALILMFLAVRNCLLFLRQQITFKKMLCINVLMLTVASLFCEFSVFFTMGLIIFLWRTWPQNREDKKWIGMLFIPIIVFFVFNLANWLTLYYTSLVKQGGYVIQGAMLSRGLVSFPVVFLRWFSMVAFPFQYEICIGERNIVHASKYFNLLSVLNIFLFIKGLFILEKNRKLLKGRGEARNLFLLFIGLVLILCFVFSLFRIGPRSISYLRQSLYWAYFFWAFLITAIYVLVSHGRSIVFSRLSFSNKAVVSICLILIGCYGWTVFGILQERAIQDMDATRLIASIEKSRQYSKDGSLDLKQFLTDPGNRKGDFFGNKSLIEILYPFAKM